MKNREDWEWLARAGIAFFFAALMGILITFFYGYLVIRLLIQAILGVE